MNLEIIGIILIILGFFLILFSLFKNMKKGEYGGIVLIGPFPIIFGTSEKIVLIVIAVSILILLSVLLMLIA